MGTHRPPVVMPDMKRRRASTGERIATIMTLARRLPLTRQVLADQLADATPSQMEFMESWMNAEIESRERSKRSRLLKAAGFPADKELDGYDWTPIRFPVDYGRGRITTLDFIAGHDDLVLFDPPGTGKTHLAIALGRNACRKGIPARYFTAAGLVMRSSGPNRTTGSTGNSPRSAGPRCSSSTNSATCPSTRTAAGSCSRSSPTRTRPRASSTPPTSSSADRAGSSATPTWPPRSSTAPSTTAG